MSSNQEPLIIKDWDLGIADSPHKGFGMIKNADVDAFPGTVKCGRKPGPYFFTVPEQTFTAVAATDVCTCPSRIETNLETFTGVAVYFTTTDTLPDPLAINTIYFITKISTTTFKVSTSYKNSVGSSAGTFINITDTGTGVHTMHQVPMGNVKSIIEDPRTSKKWALCDNGRVWFTKSVKFFLLHNSAIDTGAADVTSSNGNGLVLSAFSSTTKTFLFVFRNTSIDVIDVFGTTAIETPSWTNGWQTMNTPAGTGNSHEAIKGQDDAIYFCDSRYVGSIIENVGQTFDPGTGATYTFNNAALDLPNLEVAECLEEIGTNLVIGGNTFNKIYPWNRIANSFDMPIDVPEFSIKKLENIGGTVFILAGTWGNIYTTQGTYSRLFRKLPSYLTNNDGTVRSNPITWGGIAQVNGDLIFGVQTVTSGNSGVWRLSQDGRLTIDKLPSSGSTNATALWAENEFYYMGFSGGIESFASDLYGLVIYDDYETIIQSPLYEVGTKLAKAKYSRMEVVLARPGELETGGNIRISYRADIDSAFTVIDTINCDGVTNLFSSEEIGLTDLENIQLQIELSDDSGSGIDVELREIRLYP